MAGTGLIIDTPVTQPRSLSDLQQLLHSMRIKDGRNKPLVYRATTIIEGIKTLQQPEGRPRHHAELRAALRVAAIELSELDRRLTWLPSWKPRLALPAPSQVPKGESA